MIRYLPALLAFTFIGCEPAADIAQEMTAEEQAAFSTEDRDRLAASLGAQPEEVQVRYTYRPPIHHPIQSNHVLKTAQLLAFLLFLCPVKGNTVH